jgi:hypothetical protein
MEEKILRFVFASDESKSAIRERFDGSSIHVNMLWLYFLCLASELRRRFFIAILLIIADMEKFVKWARKGCIYGTYWQLVACCG